MLLALSLFLGTYGDLALADIVPDNTLGKDRSRVNGDKIQGGATRGNNLFHSFQEFSIKEGKRAYFIPDAKIVNIFTRVTGNKISRLDGILKVKGNANLFLLNPNGIIFGPNATLDLKGSFIATTAESFIFPDGSKFSATNPQEPPLLTVTVEQPIGIKFGNQPAQMINRSQGLQAPSGQTLALIGGEMKLKEGGIITGEDGHIDLGSVSANSVVNIIPQDSRLAVDYQLVKDFGDISLTGGAGVSTSTGEINIHSKNLKIAQGSYIRSWVTVQQKGGDLFIKASDSVTITGFNSYLETREDNGNNGGNINIETKNLTVSRGGYIKTGISEGGRGGDLNLKAKDSIKIIGFGLDDSGDVSSSKISTETLQSFFNFSGKKGNINLETARLFLKKGGEISAYTSSQADGGDINIKVSDSLEVIGGALNPDFYPSEINSKVESNETVNPGIIKINTGQLVVKNGGKISATANNGTAGEVSITARDSIFVTGFALDEQNQVFRSAIASEANPNIGEAKGETIAIDTGKLLISGGAEILTSTDNGQAGNLIVTASDSIQVTGVALDENNDPLLNESQLPYVSRLASRAEVSSESEGTDSNLGGRIEINTASLFVNEGARITTSTQSSRNAGDVSIQAQDIQLTGSALVNQQQYLSGIYAQVVSGQGANGGKIEINTQNLTLTDGGTVDASNIKPGLTTQSPTFGKAGDVIINSDTVSLQNQASIKATNFQGTGGNVTLNLSGLLSLRHGSNISTQSGDTQAAGTGGNIKINSQFVLAYPQEDSNIIGNAFAGKGGVVRISTENIFGLEVSQDFQNTSLSEILSSSQVIINVLTIKPNLNVTNLPTFARNISFSRICESNNKYPTLILYNAGRGGQLSAPSDFYTDEVIFTPWIDPYASFQKKDNKVTKFPPESHTLILPCQF